LKSPRQVGARCHETPWASQARAMLFEDDMPMRECVARLCGKLLRKATPRKYLKENR
jgi:hypothetical protein